MRSPLGLEERENYSLVNTQINQTCVPRQALTGGYMTLAATLTTSKVAGQLSQGSEGFHAWTDIYGEPSCPQYAAYS